MWEHGGVNSGGVEIIRGNKRKVIGRNKRKVIGRNKRKVIGRNKKKIYGEMREVIGRIRPVQWINPSVHSSVGRSASKRFRRGVEYTVRFPGI